METIFRKVQVQERLPKQDGDYLTNLGWNRYRIRKPSDRIEYQLWVHEIDSESGMPLKWWLEEIEVPAVEPQYTGIGLQRYNTEELYGNKLFSVKAVVMQDLKDDDWFWTNRGGGGFVNAHSNKLRGKEFDNLVVLVLAVTPNEVQK